MIMDYIIIFRIFYIPYFILFSLVNLIFPFINQKIYMPIQYKIHELTHNFTKAGQ